MKSKAYRDRIDRHHDGKKVFESEWEAKSAAALAELRYGDPQHPYECRTCGKWHIGHRRDA